MRAGAGFQAFLPAPTQVPHAYERPPGLPLLPGEDRNFVPKFLGRLGELGYVEGQNLHFVYRSAEGRPELLPDLAADLVRMKPDVLVTGFGTVAAKTGKAAGGGIPVVFMAGGEP